MIERLLFCYIRIFFVAKCVFNVYNVIIDNKEVSSMPMKPRQMVKLLKEHGFIEKSQNGSSHLKLYNTQSNITVMVPIHAKELGKGLERAILREANIEKP